MEEDKAGAAKMRREISISPRAISPRIPSSAKDSFYSPPHAFRDVFCIHETPSPCFITASTKSLLISLDVYSSASVFLCPRLVLCLILSCRVKSDSDSGMSWRRRGKDPRERNRARKGQRACAKVEMEMVSESVSEDED